MKITQEIKSKLRENYERLAFLEAINAFYQIKGLVTENSGKKSSYHAEEALYQLHQLFLNLLQEDHTIKGSEVRKIQRLINIIEEDMNRITSNTGIILDTVQKIRGVFTN
ncbi:MAG: hypothetical protein K2W94_08055 [Alphaproteobacteria bacterium]|nr:hypothetical protein [Alphaproteobacteria bacterium]